MEIIKKRADKIKVALKMSFSKPRLVKEDEPPQERPKPVPLA